MNITPTKNRLIPAVITLVLCIVSAIITFLSLNQTPYANGWDGYFYIIQVKAWFTEGAMHSSDVSLVYPLLIVAEWLVNDYILSYKTGAALIRGLFTAGVFILAAQMSCSIKENIKKNQAYIIGLCIASLSLLSPSAFFFASQFPKNLFGFTLLLFFLTALLKQQPVLFSRQNIRLNSILRLKYVILLFILTFLTHRFAGALAVMITGFYIVCMLFYNRNYKIILSTVVLLSAIVLVAVIFPGTLHLADLERFNGLFTPSLHITPWSFMQLLGPFKINLFWKLELFVYYALLIVYCAVFLVLIKKKKPVLKHYFILLALLLIGLIGIFPFYTFTLTGMAYRLFLGHLLFAPLLFVPVLTRAKTVHVAVLVFVFTAGSFFSRSSYVPEQFDPPYAMYHRMSVTIVNSLRNTPFDLIVAHKGLAEVITFSTGKDALPWKPEQHYARDKVWRVAAGIPVDTLYARFDKSVTDQRTFLLQPGYFLVREDLWEQFYNRLVAENEQTLLSKIRTWRNPLEQRPQFILKGRRK